MRVRSLFAAEIAGLIIAVGGMGGMIATTGLNIGIT
jgi:hypothetical protein